MTMVPGVPHRLPRAGDFREDLKESRISRMSGVVEGPQFPAFIRAGRKCTFRTQSGVLPANPARVEVVSAALKVAIP